MHCILDGFQKEITKLGIDLDDVKGPIQLLSGSIEGFLSSLEGLNIKNCLLPEINLDKKCLDIFSQFSSLSADLQKKLATAFGQISSK